MAYSTNDDLLKVQPNILNLGVADWTDQHNESELIVNRDIKTGWFEAAANAKGVTADFDPDLIEPIEQLTRLAVYKTLELVYLALFQDQLDDPFRQKMALFADKYKTEFNALIADGILYDWDEDGDGDESGINIENTRRLVR